MLWLRKDGSSHAISDAGHCRSLVQGSRPLHRRRGTSTGEGRCTSCKLAGLELLQGSGEECQGLYSSGAPPAQPQLASLGLGLHHTWSCTYRLVSLPIWATHKTSVKDLVRYRAQKVRFLLSPLKDPLRILGFWAWCESLDSFHRDVVQSPSVSAGCQVHLVNFYSAWTGRLCSPDMSKLAFNHRYFPSVLPPSFVEGCGGQGAEGQACKLSTIFHSSRFFVSLFSGFRKRFLCLRLCTDFGGDIFGYEWLLSCTYLHA